MAKFKKTFDSCQVKLKGSALKELESLFSHNSSGEVPLEKKLNLVE